MISLFGNVQSRLGEAVIGSAAVVAVTAVAYIGIRVAAWAQWALIAIEYIGITVLAVLCLVAVFCRHPGSVPFSANWFSWSSLGGVSGFIAASLIAVYMFSGWDTGIMVNEKTENARETPGNAGMLSVVARPSCIRSSPSPSRARCRTRLCRPTGLTPSAISRSRWQAPPWRSTASFRCMSCWEWGR